MTRIHVSQAISTGAQLVLPAGPGAHLVRVLRLQVGEHFTLFNGLGGEFDAQITAIVKSQVNVLVGAHAAIERESPLAVTLLPAVVRGERMDYVIQKATELGAHAIRPVLCTRGHVRIDSDASPRKLEHWRAVAIAACEQSGRNTLPRIHEAVPLREALDAGTGLGVLLLPGTEASLQSLLTPPPEAIAVLTGPEGGLDPAEIAMAKAAGFRPCRVGPRVLRTETAPLAVLAALQALIGDFR